MGLHTYTFIGSLYSFLACLRVQSLGYERDWKTSQSNGGFVSGRLYWRRNFYIASKSLSRWHCLVVFGADELETNRVCRVIQSEIPDDFKYDFFCHCSLCRKRWTQLQTRSSHLCCFKGFLVWDSRRIATIRWIANLSCLLQLVCTLSLVSYRV